MEQQDLDNKTNYLEENNGARIIECSSELPNAPSSNMLSSTRKNIWMSAEGMPQYFIIDMSQLRVRPTFFKFIGFDCWHDYKSNPAVIELLVSADGIKEYITWSTIYLEFKEGLQVFSIDRLGKRYGFIKILVKETFGSCQTYLNSVQLFQENPFSSRQHAQSILGREQNSIHSEMNYEDQHSQGVRQYSAQRTNQSTLEGANPLISLQIQTNQTLQTNQTIPDMFQQIPKMPFQAKTPLAKGYQQNLQNQSSERRARHNSLNSAQRQSPSEVNSMQIPKQVLNLSHNNIPQPLNHSSCNSLHTSQKKTNPKNQILSVQSKAKDVSSFNHQFSQQQYPTGEISQFQDNDQPWIRDLSKEPNFASHDTRKDDSSSRLSNYHTKDNIHQSEERIIEAPFKSTPVHHSQNNYDHSYQQQDTNQGQQYQYDLRHANNVFDRPNSSAQAGYNNPQREMDIVEDIGQNPPLILTQSEKEVASLKKLIFHLEREIKEKDNRISDSEKRIINLERSLHSILSRTSVLEGIVDTLQSNNTYQQRETKVNNNNSIISNLGGIERNSNQIEEFRTSQKRSFPLNSPQTFGKGYNNGGMKNNNSIDFSPEQTKESDQKRKYQITKNEEADDNITQGKKLNAHNIIHQKDIDIPNKAIREPGKKEKQDTSSQKLKSQPEQLPKKWDSLNNLQKNDQTHQIQKERRNLSKSRDFSQEHQIERKKQNNNFPSVKPSDTDEERELQKYQTEPTQNPRVMKLLEKLQEKLQIRSKKVDELNSGKIKDKKKGSNSRLEKEQIYHTDS